MRKHKTTAGIRGNGQEALLEPTKECLEVADETIRSKPAEPTATSTTNGRDPAEYFSGATLPCGHVERVGEHISVRRFKDIIVQGLTTDYTEMKIIICRDTSRTCLEEVQSTMPSM